MTRPRRGWDLQVPAYSLYDPFTALLVMLVTVTVTIQGPAIMMFSRARAPGLRPTRSLSLMPTDLCDSNPLFFGMEVLQSVRGMRVASGNDSGAA